MTDIESFVVLLPDDLLLLAYSRLKRAVKYCDSHYVLAVLKAEHLPLVEAELVRRALARLRSNAMAAPK